MTETLPSQSLTPPGSIIGIVAGSGQFPRLTAQAAARQGLKAVICGFHGHTSPQLSEHAAAFALFHLGQFGHVLKFFHKHRVSHVCFAGAINKPRALSIRPDFLALKIILSLRGRGDDALLRAIAAEVERRNMRVIQAAALIPGLPGPLGPQTIRKPGSEDWENILFGWPRLQAVGKLDIGQCIAVREKMIMAVECLEGTDAALRRGAELGGKGAVALKIAKPGQDERMDLPAIGLNTVRTLIEGGYSCLAYQAGKTLFFDREESIRLADIHSLSIIGLPGGLAPEEPFYLWYEQEEPENISNFVSLLQAASLEGENAAPASITDKMLDRESSLD
ncbi:MAG: UDP-2,3-diacylglucosamine diphosphatase LpxI [Desulfovibrionaceae bacterium]|nr:UDP-2,3-diacylglucosamine diphosphatase LpxI [Desulfovibrionaceae bacterium]